MTQTAKLLVDSQCALGEGPFWHEGRQQLFWFDINNRTLFAASAEGDVQSQWHFDEIVAAAAIVDDNTLAIATETGLKRFDLATGDIADIVDIEKDVPANRTNDSRVHPSGAFWIGTMVKDEGPKDGAVYHYRKGVLTKIISNAAIPNATCFSPDGRTAYWADTPEQKILKCQTDPETGMPVSEWELFADVSEHRGYPDGAVVDSEGFLWNARWGGSCVIRYAPDGSIDRIIEVPVSQVTCPAFGGKDLKRLFLTTANKTLSAEQLAAEKVAGGVFYIDLDIAGLPEAKIKL
ncbi:SMP-30/gluconolactonase/LRE family protein [Devosia sp. XJ19-1]|uniref:SMP-30/gluconolactonase/LRE family protein n=1 Tax=Devosia ureilytica TaxID=2952754 RepID=A0A9Q4ALI5_9HYPH|nr:SMP-30/gluconolactonase/LRE family protein [Devosia ureilytica]MCP8882277.1 SMP-30/gluconolactonase/LRE family protein [Devosia ureilytica]MCP8885836.1 SMP-30/gluconolactonase/LRE family protein [Devosia ureilytica]